MARKKGRDINGWLIVDKPAGVGSTAVVAKVRWALDAKKAGHAGTLDPDATGVLAVALGEATKTVAAVTDALKCYDFTVNWGVETATDDASGEVVRRSDSRPDRAAIKAALPAFTGNIMQVPPAFSAVKVDGERAYDLAREGEDLDLAARPLWVQSLTLLDCDTDTARLAHVLLPAAGWGEKDGTVTNSERRISRQRRVLPAAGQARDDWRIIADVAARMGWGPSRATWAWRWAAWAMWRICAAPGRGRSRPARALPSTRSTEARRTGWTASFCLWKSRWATCPCCAPRPKGRSASATAIQAR